MSNEEIVLDVITKYFDRAENYASRYTPTRSDGEPSHKIFEKNFTNYIIKANHKNIMFLNAYNKLRKPNLYLFYNKYQPG